MNRGVLQSPPVQQMMAAGNPSCWWSINNMMRAPPSNTIPQPSPFWASPSSFFPQLIPTPQAPPATAVAYSSWHDYYQELPESWSQVLLGGNMGDQEDIKKGLNHSSSVEAKKMENWEEQVLLHQATPTNHHPPALENIKLENSGNSFVYGHGHGVHVDHEYHPSSKPAANWSQMMSAASPKSSCVTTLNGNMLDFSSNKADGRHPPPDRSSECNSTTTGGAAKKARVQPSSTQSTFKVRKEKLGDRITALHQLVSPFGKTDTASVLLEAIGYIRFLQSQIEALSLPYLGSTGAGNVRHQQSVQGERNCLFPDDPGQLLNDNCMKRKGAPDQGSHEEPKKDLRSRGLCLVPLSCTLQVESNNGADYWAPALGGGFR